MVFVLFLAGLLYPFPVVSIQNPTDLSIEPVPDQAAAVAPLDLEISVETEGPEPETVHAGEEFVWKIIVKWYGDLGAVSPEIQREPPLDSVTPVSTSTTLKTGADGERRFAQKVFTYRFLAQAEGKAHIGAAAVRYQAGGDAQPSLLNTSPVQVNVLPAPFSFSKLAVDAWNIAWLRITVTVLFICVVIGVTIVFWLRKRSGSGDEDEPETVDPMEEAFNKAKRARVEGDHRTYVAVLEQAIRRRLAEWYPEQPSSMLSEYAERIAPDRKSSLVRFSQQVEELKYAPVAPSPDHLDRMWDDAKRIIEPE